MYVYIYIYKWPLGGGLLGALPNAITRILKEIRLFEGSQQAKKEYL